MVNSAVLLQHAAGKVIKASLSALAAARQYQGVSGGGEIFGIVLGAGAEAAARDASRFGFGKVLWSDEGALHLPVAPVYSAAIQQIVQTLGVGVVFGAATSVGKDVFPRLAVALNAGQASDIVGVNPDGTFKRPVFAGDILADIELLTPTKIVTVRGPAFSPAEPSGSECPVERATLPQLPTEFGEVVSREESGGDRPELSDAEIVVSGGRALGSAENFQKYIFPLADALGAAVGASRAAVDSGYAPNDWQVGQTGKIVAPQLYIAAGISGAIQHLAGMKDSKVIVAINKDPDAPIFEVANYALTADIFQAIPELTEAVKKAKAG